MSERYRISFDTGGTFTDIVLQDVSNRRFHFLKVPSTPDDPARAIVDGVGELLKQLSITGSDLGTMLHATTVPTNAIIERKGSRVALITTKGFRDVVLIGRQKRYETYDLHMSKPEPLVRRSDIFEVDERIDSDGSVYRTLDENSLEQAVAEIRDGGYEAVAVSFLHSYANDVHEQRVRDYLSDALDGVAISLSSEVSPKFREYERTSTVLADAYVKSIVSRYIDNLRDALKGKGSKGEVMVMQSAGGLLTTELVKRFPIKIVESGPAAGVLMCAKVAKKEGYDHVLTFDMGGTTAKLGAVENGVPAVTPTFEVDQVSYRAGSGLPLNISAVELIEIGAGGGSIASVDMNIINVGPESAGAVPGPACYGNGGEYPTVTDANVVMGYINPGYFNGGAFQLDREASIRAVSKHVADPLGISVEEAAWGIYTMANSNMTRAMRVISVEKGRDPSKCAIVAFGGAGPLHACRIASSLSVPKVMVPYGAGVGSAVGLLAAHPKLDAALTKVVEISDDTLEQINELYSDLETRLKADLKFFSDVSDVRWRRMVYARYVGQGYEIGITLPDGAVDTAFVEKAASLFHEAYERNYGYCDRSSKVAGVEWTLEVEVAGGDTQVAAEFRSQSDPVDDDARQYRQAYFPEADGFVECAILRRGAMIPGEVYSGPVIVEDDESTVVVSPNDRAEINANGDLVIAIGSGE